MSRGKIVILIALIAAASLYSLYRRSVAACRQSDRELNQRAETLRGKAHDKLKVGSTKKGDVLRFFGENGIPLEDDEEGVHGEVRAPGCYSGCGTFAVIRVKAKCDEAANLKSEPRVDGVCPDCT